MNDERYRKQMLFAGVGPLGQQRLRNSRVLLVGCGALGCVSADFLVRAGAGHIRIVDRDFVELSNLQRQSLFTEDDVTAHLPKSIAAAERLRRINSEIAVEPHVADVDFSNIEGFADGCDLILDGTDNFEVRYLINDVSLHTGIPWIFTGCTGSYGQVMPIFPGESACLRCLMESPPPAGSVQTCDTAGVLGPAVGAVASLQSAIAIRILVSEDPAAEIPRKLTIIDVWEQSFRQIDLSDLRDKTDCPACRNGERLWLHGQRRSGSTVLCGRNAVQVTPAEKLSLSLRELAARLEPSGTVMLNSFLLRFSPTEAILTPASSPDFEPSPIREMTIFPDGRAIIRGTEDPNIARSIYLRYVGG
ncbi:MAG: ThiF family adenylyltransferase [Planctomyces sp.]|jgi:molybdopterin/thiamine biosynthesis adenylyltransferase